MADDRLLRRDYYVYILFRWNGWPLYVGKGQGDRINEHLTPKNLAKNLHRAKAIRKTLLFLGDVPRIKIAENLTQDEALDLERRLILAIGRYPDGPLVNATDGGDGPYNFSDEVRRKISEAATRTRTG